MYNNLVIVDLSAILETGISEPVAWIVEVRFLGTRDAKSFRVMPRQLGEIQATLGARGSQDCIGKRIQLPNSSYDLKAAFESVVGPVAEAQQLVVV